MTTLTLEHFEQALPDVLAQHERDLISAIAAGRVLVVEQAPGTTVKADGSFSWVIHSVDVQECARITRAHLGTEYAAGFARVIAECRERDSWPVVLIADGRMKVVAVPHGGASN